MTQLDVAHTFLCAVPKLHTGFRLESEGETSHEVQSTFYCQIACSRADIVPTQQLIVLSLPIKDTCCTLDIQFWNHMIKIKLEQFRYGCNMKL